MSKSCKGRISVNTSCLTDESEDEGGDEDDDDDEWDD